MTANSTTRRLVAYVDEAGELGYARRLLPDHDDLVGLMLAVVVGDVTALTTAFQPAFDDLQRTAPPGATLHITDALASTDRAWRTAGEQARSEALRVLTESSTSLIYDARRCRLEREAFQRGRSIVDAAAAMPRRSTIRPNVATENPRIEERLFQGLVLKLDAYAVDTHVPTIDVRFDQTSKGVRGIYEDALAVAQNVENSAAWSTGYDPATQTPHRRDICIRVTGASFDVKRVGTIDVTGKSDPAVLIADIAANSLLRHLRSLSGNTPLNAPKSIADWVLGPLVYGVRDEGFEDLL